MLVYQRVTATNLKKIMDTHSDDFLMTLVCLLRHDQHNQKVMFREGEHDWREKMNHLFGKHVVISTIQRRWRTVELLTHANDLQSAFAC